ncbi:hypothetical protein SDC9_77662 [bioreactor metagenome]|uniref:Uncharacterized protein n=1 Tax=bioreactor metagenome TaxID=1076179 RepID=A0A644YS13_9ZZZZ
MTEQELDAVLYPDAETAQQAVSDGSAAEAAPSGRWPAPAGIRHDHPPPVPTAARPVPEQNGHKAHGRRAYIAPPVACIAHAVKRRQNSDQNDNQNKHEHDGSSRARVIGLSIAVAVAGVVALTGGPRRLKVSVPLPQGGHQRHYSPVVVSGVEIGLQIAPGIIGELVVADIIHQRVALHQGGALAADIKQHNHVPGAKPPFGGQPIIVLPDIPAFGAGYRSHGDVDAVLGGQLPVKLLQLSLGRRRQHSGLVQHPGPVGGGHHGGRRAPLTQEHRAGNHQRGNQNGHRIFFKKVHFVPPY